MNASLFVLLFVLLLLFFSCCFFRGGGGGGGQGVGVGFVVFLGSWNTTQRDVNTIYRTSECYSWQRKFDRRRFVCFVFLFVCFFVFISFLLFFGGDGWLSLFGGGVRGIDYPNYAPSTVLQKILTQFHFRFVLLFVVV